ncbi:hypothetical protein E2F47_11560 [Mycobacterium eburneum]|nr:hypothetical protein [Mycobacterium eburneum]TDH54157.1 hypothetical protein E2F47_11560 [Mycobacterium eburneum]
MPGSFEIELRFAPGDPESFEGYLDAVADELVKLGVEPDYAANLADQTAIWWLDAPDASEDSLIGALTALRAAFGAASGVVSHEVTAARHLASV